MLLTRRTACVLAGAAALGGSAARAASLPAPSGKAILTVTGKIGATNKGDSAVFDRAMIESLGMASLHTHTPWHDHEVLFEGVPMVKLMAAVAAGGQTLEVLALNDYATQIPITDFAQFDVLLALKRDGDYMPVRDKGPLFIVYPYDSNPALAAQPYYDRSAWQVARMIVK